MPRERLVELAERAVGLHDRTAAPDGGDDASPLHLHGLRPAELFWLATAQAASDRPGNAEGYYDLGLSLSDTDGHFPEEGGQQSLEPSPKPALLAHLLFLHAADAVGGLTTIPKSGYTGRRQRV